MLKGPYPGKKLKEHSVCRSTFTKAPKTTKKTRHISQRINYKCHCGKPKNIAHGLHFYFLGLSNVSTPKYPQSLPPCDSGYSHGMAIHPFYSMKIIEQGTV